MTGRIWTYSNALSFIRVLLTIPISVLIVANQPENRIAVVTLILIAVLTDYFDGLLARKLGQVTEVGKIIDPIADKLAVGVVTIILAQQGKVPAWFLILVLSRDLLIFGGGVYISRTRKVILQSNWTGKWAVTVVSLYILVAVIDMPELNALKLTFLAACTLMLLLSFILYANRFRSVLVSKPERKQTSAMHITQSR